MIQYLLFYAVILAANIIQGITGFAGTILAMPFGIMLVGYEVAKPVLNVLAIVSGVYVFWGAHKSVNWKELAKIVAVMTVGIFGGIYIKGLFAGREQLLYKLLGVFVIVLAVQGMYTLYRKKPGAENDADKQPSPLINLILIAAGIVHGMFVAGGPLLISYLTKKIKDKVSFRATISTVWIFLNTLLLVDDVRVGYWTPELFTTFLITVPFLLAGMFIGSKLYAKMSQLLFMKITYVLLFVSGISLFVK